MVKECWYHHVSLILRKIWLFVPDSYSILQSSAQSQGRSSACFQLLDTNLAEQNCCQSLVPTQSHETDVCEWKIPY